MARVFLLLLLSCCWCALVAHAQPSATVGPARASGLAYQIHSQNDLRQWTQTIAKGATWFKVDFSYQSPDFCQQQTTNATHPTPVPAVARVDPATSALGCFLLNHDTPVLTRTTPYNTSGDLLAWLTANAPTRLHADLHIAICLKFSLPASSNLCDGSPAAANATQLFDAFFAAASAMQQQLPDGGPTIEFILDGSLVPVASQLCLKDKWLPWNATWIDSEGPSGAYQSDDPTSGFERFQVNNMNALTDFPTELLSNYCKFAKQGEPTTDTVVYPYLVWEPEDQLTLGIVSGGYLAGQRHIMPDPTEAGLRFATNLDPVQQQVYTAAAGDAWNSPLVASATNFSMATAAFPRVAVWSGDMFPSAFKTSSVPSLMLTLWSDSAATSAARFFVHLHQFAWALAEPWTVEDVPVELVLDERMARATQTGRIASVVSLPAIVVVTDSGSTEIVAPLLLADDSGFLSLYDATELSSSSAASPVWNATLPAGDFSVVSGTFAAQFPLEGGFYTLDGLSLIQATSNATCALKVTYFMVLPDRQPHAIGQAPCLIPVTPGGSALSIDPASVSISIAPNSASASCGTVDVGIPFISYLLAFSATTAATGSTNSSQVAQVYASYGCIGMKPLGLFVSSSVPTRLGPGSSTSVSLLQRPFVGSPYALLAIENGYCWNNEYTNKRPDIALCDSIGNNQTQVLTYSYGQMAAFVELLSGSSGESSTSGSPLLSPCSDVSGFVHGTYDMGSQPFVTLFTAPEDESATKVYNPQTWSINLVEVHRGYVDTTEKPTTAASGAHHATSSGASTSGATSIASQLVRERRSAHVVTPRPTGMAAPVDSSPHSLRSRTRSKQPHQQQSSFPTPVPASACGAPIPYDGLVMDSWLLPTLPILMAKPTEPMAKP